MKFRHRILIVDDDADDREMIKDAFVHINDNFDYVFLENGDRLMEYLKTQSHDSNPSLIMLDLNMPGKDGRESLREIKSDQSFHSIPTIVFTTSSSNRDRGICYDLGANCFTTKPDTFDKLTALAGCICQLWLA